MNVFQAVVICMSFLSFSLGQNDTYFITLPNLLLVETTHHFNIHSSVNLLLKIVSIHQESQIKRHSPNYLIQKGYGTIPYHVPFVGKHVGSKILLKFYGDKCLNVIDCNLSKLITGNFINETYELGLIDKNFIIFAETDKPLYKPGEKVRLRFLPIYATNLLREPESVGKQWEIYRNATDPFQIKEFNGKNISNEFNMIFIENPDGVRMAQWTKVPLKDAMNLEYQLTKDPVLGLWKSKAMFRDQVEVLEFTVKKYVLPRFTVDILPPEEILSTDTKIKFKICAKYSNNKNIKAEIVGKMCIRYWNERIKCQIFTSFLKNESCVKIKLNSTDVFPNEYESTYDSKSVINVTVTENGTTSSVSKSIVGKGIQDSPYIIKFESQAYFKPGLPYFGRLRLLRHSNKPEKNTSILISITNWYDGIEWGFQNNYTSDKNGIIDFIIPYIPEVRSLQIHMTGDGGKMKPVTAFQTLSSWESVDKHYLQISPIESTIRCPGNLTLKVLTNYDVSTIVLYSQIFSRGQIKKINEYPPIPVKCFSRDDFLGHYHCQSDGSLVCLSGWTGDNCREPICDYECVNGACVKPNQCICKTGWKGESCDACILAQPCKNGYCVRGNDCNCFPGWRGYDCSIKGPKIHSYRNVTNIPLTTKKQKIIKKSEKQSIFERLIEVPLLKNMGPDVHIILYFISVGNEVVADAVEIPNNLQNCTNVEGGQFQFSKKTSFPKSNITLTLDPGIKNSSCAVRISDVTLTQFGSSSNVDLLYLINKLITINHRIISDSDSGRNLCLHNRIVPNTRRKRMIRPWWNRRFDSRNILLLAGFSAITNARLTNIKCYYEFVTLYRDSGNVQRINVGAEVELASAEAPKSSVTLKKTILEKKEEYKKQIRDFFPESWLFAYYDKPLKEINLTVPDSITTWQANSYCVTEKGIWIPPAQSLTVTLPFYIDIYVPYSIKLDEELHLPVKIFNYMDYCYEVHIQINVNISEINVVGFKSFTLCLCSKDEKTVYFNLKPKLLGKLNITVEAKSKYTNFCSKGKKNMSDIDMSDAIRRQLLVEPQGVPTETVYSELICSKNEQVGIIELFQIPTHIVPGSLRSYLTFNGDVMGQTFDNLDKIVKMPYGCGEQNMVAVVPSIYVLQYLNELQISNPVLSRKAKEYIIEGYKRQMNFKHDDGSFSAFGKTDKVGSTWLTAFVLRSFSDASLYVNVEERIIVEAVKYLKAMQLPNGCFKENGKLFSSVMAGNMKKSGETDEILLTAYILISLKNVNVSNSGINVTKALSCIEMGLKLDVSNYKLSLISYAFTLYHPLTNKTNLIVESLLKRSITNRRYKYWGFTTENIENGKVNAADIETTGYAFLALQNYQSFSESLKTVYWMSNQRNSLGGYYSTQDTIVGLNALAVFSKTIGLSSSFNLNVSVVIGQIYSFDKDKMYTDHINEDNRLVSRVFNLGAENVSYISIKTNGSGCLNLQLISLYNINKLYSAKDSFRLYTKTNVPSVKQCNSRQIEICFAYLRRDKSSNMLLLMIEYPSGWQLSEKEKNNLLRKVVSPLNRIDFQNNKMDLYFDSFSYNEAEVDYCFPFLLEEKVKISNIQPALVKLVDYYSPEVYTDTTYNISLKICEKNDTKVINIPKLSCPVCGNTSEEFVKRFLKMICQSSFSGLVLQGPSGTKNRTLYQPQSYAFYEWTVDLLPENCTCLKTWTYLNNSFVIVSTQWMSLNEKLILSNDSVLFPFDILYSAFSSDLSRQCSAAYNMFLMVNRVIPNLENKLLGNNTCAKCVLESYFYFNIKNVTEWFCANYTDWKVDVKSVYPIVKGSLKKDNFTVDVEMEFPNDLCYCREQILSTKKTFRIIDLQDTLSTNAPSSSKPFKLMLDDRYEMVEESVFSSYSYIKCF